MCCQFQGLSVHVHYVTQQAICTEAKDPPRCIDFMLLRYTTRYPPIDTIDRMMLPCIIAVLYIELVCVPPCKAVLRAHELRRASWAEGRRLQRLHVLRQQEVALSTSQGSRGQPTVK